MSARGAKPETMQCSAPLGWTVSCGGFDRLPGVVILELCWAQVAERGVQSAGVVDLINKAWKIGGHVFEVSSDGKRDSTCFCGAGRNPRVAKVRWSSLWRGEYRQVAD